MIVRHLSVIVSLLARRVLALSRLMGETLVYGGSEIGVMLVYAFALRGSASALLGGQAMTYALSGMLGAQAFQSGVQRGATLFIARDIDFFLATPVPRGTLTAGLLLGDVIERSIVSWLQVLGASLLMDVTPAKVMGGCLASTLIIAAGMTLGTGLSVIFKNPFVLIRVMMFLLLPQAIVCGAYFPVVNQGPVISWLRNFMPVEYAIDLTHRVFMSATDGNFVRHTLGTSVGVCSTMIVFGVVTTAIGMDGLRGRGPDPEFGVNN
jgi:hypothetical protein